MSDMDLQGENLPCYMDQSDKFHNENVPYLTVYHFVTEMCTFLFECGVLWDVDQYGIWIRCIVEFVRLVYWDIAVMRCELIVRCILYLWYISRLSSVFLNFQVRFWCFKVCQLQVNYFSFFYSQLIISWWLFERNLMETECKFKLIIMIWMV